MKKGFTLIELLAVIIILAILMIIAVPNILSTLAAARSSAFITQSESIYKSAEQQYIIDSMTNAGNLCYDKNNLNLGSISSTISFAVQMNSNNGTVSSIAVVDSGQGLKVTGTTMNNIALVTYTNETLSCSGSLSNTNNSNNSNTSQVPVTYTESLLNGTDPVIAGDLVPVVLSQDSATSNNQGWIVTKADTFAEWYKYEDGEWANAVRLVANPSKSYVAGEVIAHSDISAYFVWIPKYKYKLFDMGNYNSATSVNNNKHQLIEIQFGTTNTTDVLTGDTQSCATPGVTGESGNCAVGRWMTHPAFLAFNKNGFWVGKFNATGTYSNGTIDSITVLPLVTPISSVRLNEIFDKALAYDGNGSNAVLDSHLFKNTEWGAVAYLSHSSYGMGDNNIYINNYYNNGYKTGCVSAGPNTDKVNSCTNEWYTAGGFNGSTSGNITGIYDMVGGVWEFVAGFRNVSSGNIGSSNINVSSTTGANAKYFDVYNNSSNVTSGYNNRILGDATGEMGPFNGVGSWYGDTANFIISSYPWIRRGGDAGYKSNGGLFMFNTGDGNASGAGGFRIVLAP